MKVQQFYEPETGTLSYVVYHSTSYDAVIIDPLLDFSLDYWRVSDESSATIEKFVAENKLSVKYILDTHIHADHLSAANHLRQKLNCQYAIGEKIADVQKVMSSLLGIGENFHSDGRQFDRLLRDDEELSAGKLSIKIIHTPGHTPACCSYYIGDAVFVGDVLFQPDLGVARCDFPGGNANTLYHSITKKLFLLPDNTRIFLGHDYPANRKLAFQTTINESKRINKDITPGMDEHVFAHNVNQRDKRLPLPRLFFQSVQFNLNGAEFLHKDAQGRGYFKIPVNLY